MRDEHGMVGVYFEVAAVIVALVLLGEWLELAARGRTSAAIRQLLGLAPKTAWRILPDGNEEEVPLESIVAGDRVRVRPGEKVPVDGPAQPLFAALAMSFSSVSVIGNSLRLRAAAASD